MKWGFDRSTNDNIFPGHLIPGDKIKFDGLLYLSLYDVSDRPITFHSHHSKGLCAHCKGFLSYIEHISPAFPMLCFIDLHEQAYSFFADVLPFLR